MKKKNKTLEQAPADFKNNPFKALKGITAKPGPVQKTPEPPPKEKVLSAEDDAALFIRAMEGARKIESDEAFAATPRKQSAPKKVETALPEDNQLFLQTMQKMGATFQDVEHETEEEEFERRSSSSRMRQLKRGTIRITQELDLHGFLKDEALKRLEHFTTSAFTLGHQAVLVITGKGINSPEGPVLQGAVASWLQSNAKGIVAEFGPAPRDKGGSGAYVVFLKKRT
jgi:DNA-nicking Smr family endonuclease